MIIWDYVGYMLAEINNFIIDIRVKHYSSNIYEIYIYHLLYLFINIFINKYNNISNIL